MAKKEEAKSNGYNLPSSVRLDWTFRTCSVAIRRRLSMLTVVIDEFSGLMFDDNKSTWFDLFIFTFKTDNNGDTNNDNDDDDEDDDDRCATH